MKLFKGILETLATLIYIFVITIFMYIAWAGWFKIIPSSRLKEDDAPLIAMVLNFLYLLILFILSFVTEGTIQDNIMVFMIFNWFYNAIFIIIGILLYMIVPDKK
ncbi:hypothetical protein UFOVP331_110 [uncultured Caudovirales phage]|uniref:Uncharacterized protein n=1 Tax=uncultured Caudovirales phage TaxID=2100421 RepID=A0A6J5M0G9_9CAUD|nr:hypothetical protein UFOVP331_110 [uncultured Caudovirales phage]